MLIFLFLQRRRMTATMVRKDIINVTDDDDDSGTDNDNDSALESATDNETIIDKNSTQKMEI